MAEEPGNITLTALKERDDLRLEIQLLREAWGIQMRECERQLKKQGLQITPYLADVFAFHRASTIKSEKEIYEPTLD